MFNGVPEISLSTVTLDGDGSQRIAWDAVALVPAASARTVKVLHWNVSGALLNQGDYYVVDRLVSQVLAKRPDVLSVNEICVNQFDALKARLVAAGYQMEGHFGVTNQFTHECFNEADNRTDVGNAVLVRGPKLRTQDYVFMAGNALVENGVPVPLVFERAVACLTTRFSDTNLDTKICVTHLETGFPERHDAEEQARELARRFGPEARQAPFILIGDTNIFMPPDTAALGTLYSAPIGTGDFSEIEQERGCVMSPTCDLFQGGTPTYNLLNGPNKKLDYVFADRWHFYIPPGRVQTNIDVGTCGEQPHLCSDHAMVYGEVVLPTP